jgi:hypothetical protein
LVVFAHGEPSGLDCRVAPVSSLLEMARVSEVFSVLGHFFNDFDVNKAKRENFPFPVRVAVVKNLPPRDEFFQYALDVGRGTIERLFKGNALEDDSPVFVFPERWMSV